MRALHPLFSVLLAVALSATGISGASLHGAADHARSVEICAGGEIVTIALDPRGDGEAPAQPCLDCLPVAACITGPSHMPKPESTLRAAALRMGAPPAPAIGARADFHARAPPLPA